MAAGHWNGRNHGGLHTGTGKYQHGGVYSTNGFRKKTVPHREFTVGRRVAYIGRHKDFQGQKGEGVLISKQGDKMKTSRSFLKVNLTDGRKTYFRKEQLVFL
tara:strand:+ start:41 stop:346 length:306 start_codon:yes stop_codon:yes gene_type:complete